jgi:hypothetical protein
MAANTAELSDVVSKAITPTLSEYGLEMAELYIENISLPPEVEKVLDQRTSMGIVGDLNKYTQFSAAQAMSKAAEGGGDSGMGAGLGAGMGMGMGMAMAQAMGAQAAQPAVSAPPPPPPASETMWHIAENGQTRGPIPQSQLAGQITRDTLVWTEGQSGWLKAGDIPALSRLFASMPPRPRRRWADPAAISVRSGVVSIFGKMKWIRRATRVRARAAGIGRAHAVNPNRTPLSLRAMRGLAALHARSGAAIVRVLRA